MGQIGMAHLLSLPTKNTMLKVPPPHLYAGFKNPKAKEAIAKFDTTLRQAREKILQNSTDRVNKYVETHPGHAVYPYLLRGMSIHRGESDIGSGYDVHPNGEGICVFDSGS